LLCNGWGEPGSDDLLASYVQDVENGFWRIAAVQAWDSKDQQGGVSERHGTDDA
jgi:hypothetical protein